MDFQRAHIYHAAIFTVQEADNLQSCFRHILSAHDIDRTPGSGDSKKLSSRLDKLDQKKFEKRKDEDEEEKKGAVPGKIKAAGKANSSTVERKKSNTSPKRLRKGATFTETKRMRRDLTSYELDPIAEDADDDDKSI